MACAVNRQPLTAQTGFYPRPAHVGFVVDKVTMREAFLRVLRFYPLQIIPLLPCNWQGLVFNNKIICAELNYYEGWNFNSGNYLFTTDTK